MSVRRTLLLLVPAVALGAVAGQLSGGAPGTLIGGLVALGLLASAFLPPARRADPPEPIEHPQRRRPMIPPPTRGRWDEAPRL
jgi:hypothetical protein